MAVDAVASLALGALDAAVNGLMPAPVPASLTRDVQLLPRRMGPSGLGGYVGTHPDPRGSIQARKVEATLAVSIRGGQESAAAGHLQQIIQTLLTQDRGDLRRLGIFRLQLDDKTVESRSARFDLLYEYRHLPTATEGQIEQLDLRLLNNRTPYQARFRWDFSAEGLVGLADPLADFLVADDPDLNAASPAAQWSFNGAEARIEQNAAARGGPLKLTQPKKAGAQLLWQPGGLPLVQARQMAVVDFASTSGHGIGLVFGRVDDDNFWYFLASEQNRYHLFGRKQAGAYSFVGTPAEAVGYALGDRHRLTITAYDRTLTAELDGVHTLTVTAEEPLTAGGIGFLTHGNDAARFYGARLIELV